MLRYYYASITEIDAKVGMLVDYLKANDLYDNTTIIFSADHGDSAGIHHGLTDKSVFMYEESIRIPLIVKPASGGTTVGKGGTLNAFVHSADLYSTVLELAGDTREAVERDGCSLVPLLAGEDVSWRNKVVVQSEGIDFLLHSQRALRMDQFKYVFNAGGCDELYDLASDPYELENLSGRAEYHDLERHLQQELDQWMEENNDGLQERYRRLRMRDLFE
jgi:arylsulfatase A-like enzyme